MSTAIAAPFVSSSLAAPQSSPVSARDWADRVAHTLGWRASGRDIVLAVMWLVHLPCVFVSSEFVFGRAHDSALKYSCLPAAVLYSVRTVCHAPV